LLAPLAGYLNDRFSKNRWLTGGNLVKLVGAALAWFGRGSSPAWLGIGYFTIGIGVCVYSPARYGILPEILPAERLVKANGLMQALTLIAILTGNIGGSAAFGRAPLGTCYLMGIGVYGMSLVLSLLMSHTPAYPGVRLRGSLRHFFSNLAELFSHGRLARILVGTALFWICGAILKMNFQSWGQQVLRLTTMLQVSLLGLWLSVGIMIGSVSAGLIYAVGDLQATRLYGWLLASGIAALGSMRWLMSHSLRYPNYVAPVLLVFAGAAAGLFLIPLNAALQAESPKDKLGKTIATQNGFENLAMLGGAFLAFIDVKAGFNPSELFLALAVFAAVVGSRLKIPAK
jgi:LPLT family lysophospholipid transporter-like MFS transporter